MSMDFIRKTINPITAGGRQEGVFEDMGFGSEHDEITLKSIFATKEPLELNLNHIIKDNKVLSIIMMYFSKRKDVSLIRFQ